MKIESFFYRLWSILPGFLAWATIATLLVLSFLGPNIVLVFILGYTSYWLVKLILIAGHLIAGFVRYRRESSIDWWAKLQVEYPNRETIHQIAIIPTYKEDISILRQTLNAIKGSAYDHKKIIVVVAFEEREKQLAPEYAKILRHEFEHAFGHFMVTFHPSSIEGEVIGKGPNITWSGREVKKYIDQQGIAYEKVLVTTLDADNRVDRQYFANLSWNYLQEPDPVYKSFQPLPMFFNNIHDVPLAVKMVATGSTFWQMTQAMRPHFLRNFSAHAQTLAALVKTDFWSVTTVVEDGHQYWRSYFAFRGAHEVVPIFVPIYMDAVQGEGLYDTFREQYLQRRRWFWGVSDIPFVFVAAWKDRSIPFLNKWIQFVRLFDSHFSLATQSFILAIGWVPISLHPEFRDTVLGYNFPVIYRILLTLAWIGMITTMTISAMLVPKRSHRRHVQALSLLREWVLTPILLPVTSLLFAALPALDSQTRLMLNRPFTVFNVTKKSALPTGILRQSES